MKKQEEILNDQVGNLTEGKGEQLLYHQEIEGTPFVVIGQEEKYFVALGHYRISEVYNNPEDAEHQVHAMEWEFLMNVITVLVTEIVKEKLAEKN